MKRIVTLFLSQFIFYFRSKLQQIGFAIALPKAGKIILFIAFTLTSGVGIAQPGTQASGILVSPVSGSTTSLRFDWTSGNGSGPGGRIVVIKDATGAFVPVNATDYTTGTSADFNAAADRDSGPGVAKIVALISGAGTTLPVTNLAPNATYYVQVYEFDGATTSPTFSFVQNSTNPLGFKYYTSTSSFTVPVDVTSLNVRVWGGGGGGGNSGNLDGANAGGAGGGGGGAYSSKTVGVTAGNSYTVTVGNGGSGAPGSSTTAAGPGEDSWFDNATNVMAKGGSPGVNVNSSNGSAGGNGGTAGSGFGTITNSGGNGGAGLLTTGGGGGSSAGPNSTGAGVDGAVGADGQTSGTGGALGGAGGTAVIGGGAGSNGGVNTGGNTIVSGSFPGGGGGGSEDEASDPGAAGGGGLVLITFNDNTSPIVNSIVRQTPTNAYIKSTTTSVTFRVTFNENVGRVDITDFTLSGTAVGSSVVNAVNTISASVYDVVITSTGAGNGNLNLDFGSHNIVDISNNAFGGSITSEQEYTIDNAAPTIFAVGTVATVGGNIVSGFYNNTNTGITVEVPIDNDASLVGGNIQLRIDDDGNSSYNDLGGTVAIPTANTTQVINISEAQLTATSEFADPSVNPITFTAIVTDAAGNSANFTVSVSTLQRSEAAPATPSVPDLIVASDLGASSTDNITNDNTPTFDVTGSTGLLLQILEGSNVIAFTNSATGATEQLTASTLTDNSSYSITARVTNAIGSIATSVAMSPVLNIDTAPPPTPSVPDLQTGSDSQGASNSDNITNDLTPTFDVTGTNTLRLDVMEGINVLATAASATGSSQPLNTTLAAGNTFAVFARTTDVAGNTAVSSTLNVTIDNQAPTVLSITPFTTQPTKGLISRSGTISVSASTAVTGTSTLFTTELDTASVLVTVADAPIGTVATISTPTTLTLGSSATHSGVYNEQFYFTVTFSEPITTGSIAPADFSETGTGTLGTVVPTNSGPGKSSSFRVYVSSLFGDTGGTTSQVNKTADAYQDVAGNSSTATFAGGTADIDNTAPAAQAAPTAPVAGANISTAEEAAGVVIRVPLNTGTATTLPESGDNLRLLIGGVDFGSPILYTLTPGDISATFAEVTIAPGQLGGAGAKSITARIEDFAGNIGAASAALALTVDFTDPTFTATAPLAGANVSNTNVSFTPSETLSAGTVVWTWVSGTPDGNHTAILTGSELNTIPETNVILVNNPTNLVSGAVYDISFNGTDLAGNTGSVTNAGVTYNDNSAPTSFTVGTLTPGPAVSTRVVAGYINSTNTNLTVRVPLSTTDGSLEGGTIQIQVQNTTNVGFVDVPNTGLYTIVQADRIAGFKDLVVAKTDLALAVLGATGFAEGVVGNAAAAESRKIEINAVVADNAANSTPYTKSVVQLDVDQTIPNLVTSIKVYDNKGIQNGSREVIIFRLSEDAYTSAGALVADNALFVNGVDITYGSAGFSVDDPPGGNDLDANYVRYESDGLANAADGTVLNTRLIWIESNNNNSNWASSPAPVTKVQYLPLGAASSSALIIRDAAGNELGAFTTDVSVGDIIAPAVNPNVMTLFPRSTNTEKIVFTLSEALSTSTAADAVTGFSTTGVFPDASVDIATYSEASPGVCPCTITLTSLADGNWTSATQVWYDMGTGNVLDLASNELVTIANHAVVVETVAPSITSVSIPAAAMKVGSVVTATITVANDDGDTPVLTSGTINGFPLTVLNFSGSPTSKTVQFTVAENGADRLTGDDIPIVNLVLSDGQGNNSTAFITPISQVGDPIDAHSPTISTITNTLATVYEGAKTQTVTVVYNETMNTAVQPTISLTGGSTHWGAQTPFGGTNGWVGNIYTARFIHDGFEEPANDPSISVTSSVAIGGAQDAAGNPNLGTLTSSAFVLDTKKPTATVSVSPSTINIVNDILTVTVDFSKAMNTSVAPAISFTIGTGVSNFNPTGAGVWSNGDKRYVRSYQQLNNFTSLTNSVSVNTGQDVAGNVQTASAASGNFIIDRVAPTVSSVNRVTQEFTNLASLQYAVTFNELVTGLTNANFDPFVVSGTVVGASVTGFTTSDNITYTVTVSIGAGSNGVLRLDVNTSGSAADARSNAFVTSFNTGQTYTIDTTPPVIVDIVHNTSLFNSWGIPQFITTPAYNGNQLDFTLTFDEDVVNLADAHIFDNVGTATIGFPTVSFTSPPTIEPVDAGGTPLIPNTLPSRYWKVTYTSVAGSGYIFPHFRNVAPFVRDQAGNIETHTATDFFGFEDGINTRYYYVAMPEPSLDVADASFISAGVSNTDINLQWNHSGGTQQATDYLIRAKQSNIGIFPPSASVVDGTLTTTDTDASDGVLLQHYASNAWPSGPASQITATSFSGLRSGVDYDFEIYPYSFSDNSMPVQQVDYKITTPATVTLFPTTANSATISSGGSTLPFSSLTTSGPLALAHLTNFRFTITDESTDQDNAPFKFSGLIIKKNTAIDIATGQDDIPDWTEAIQTAYLVDLSTGLIDSIATITPTSIQFASIPSSLSEIGYIADATSKTYDLHIRLKKDLGATLPAIIDGLNFSFVIDNASFTLNNTYDAASNSQRSTGLVPGQTIFTIDNRNQVTVVAEKLVFRQPGTPGVATEPQAQIGLATPFSSVPVATRPTVRALDRYNNLDLGYNNTATITNTLSLGQSVSGLNFVGGVLALDPLSFTTHNVSATQIVVTVAGVTPATSAGVNTFISNLTTITDGLTLPASELANFTSITNTTPAAYNFDFRISDDVTADATNFTNNDGLPTLVQTITITQGANNGNNGGGADAASFDNWTKSILGAQLKAVGSTQTVSGTINSGSLVFNIPAGSFMENVPNDGSTDYELRIWLRNPIDSTGATNLRTILDNKDYSFAIDVSNITINASAPNATSTKAGAGSASTADNTNQVQVHATKLKFPTHPASSQQYDAAITPSPVVWATDANGNIDLGYTGTPTVTTLPNGARTYPPLASTNTLTNSSGTITFDNTGPDVYTLTSAGGGFSGDVTRLVVSGGLNDQGAAVTAANSNTFSLNYSNTSDIVRDGTFTHPTDIEYYLNRESSSLTVGNSIPLDRFTLRDGGSSFNDTDGSKTRLQSITLNVTNYENIRLIALFDETGIKLQQLDSTFFAATGDITFSSLAVFEDDDNNLDAVLKKFTVRVSFQATVGVGVNRDNQQINVSVVSASAAGVSSQLISPLTILGDALGTDKNKIEVVATRIDFTTIPATASISVPIAPPNSPQIVVSARDAFASLDLDYNGTISATETNPSSDLLFHTLNDPTGPFSGGQLTYPSTFQFDIGDGNVQLTINSGAGSGSNNVNAGAIAGTSPTISVISSFESRITYPTGYTIANIPNTIPYVDHQSANLATTDDSFELIRYAVADGTADGSADGDTPGVPGDLDGAATVLNTLKIGVSNYTAIRSIAAYNDAGVRIVNGVIAPVAGILGEVTFDFTGNEIIAGDDAQKMFSIRATFQSSPTLVSDTMHIRVSLRSAVLGTGSKFYDVPPLSGTYVVGNPPGNVTAPKTKNEIDVTATSLDFVTPASPFAGIDEPVGPTYTTPPQPSTSAAIVHARDKFGLLDLGFHNIAAAISGASMAVTDTSDFNYGVLDLDAMQYNSAGDGTLTVVAGGINSSSPVCGTCNSIPGQPVDVVNVSVTPAASGVLTTSNIKGGTQGAIIFGVTFTPDHSTTAQPSLSGFTFSFDFPYKTATTTIFKGFVVKEGSTDVETLYSGATVTEVSSNNDTDYDLIVVNFPTAKPELFDASTGSAEPLTFYLVVDVDLSANISTQNLTPQLIDAGYGDATDNNIILTQGTATANVVGQTYQFASTRPPVLQTAKESRTLPFRGQLNVDANIDEITLEFDVQVWSLDGKAELFETKNNTKIANLVATNGMYVNSSTLPEDSIVYTINFLPGKSLKPDSVYYVAVAKGSFDNITNIGKGVSDNGFNFYGGTSFNGTLYFKVSSTEPPILSSATSYFSNLTSGVFSTTFDKTGTAYYMVLDHNTFVAQGNGVGNTPTIANIENPTSYNLSFPGSVIKTDRYEITQISSPQYVSFTADLIAGRTYDVWIYANSDAEPDTIAAPQPYGASPGFAIGGAGPTVKITLPTAANIKQTKIPDYLLCPGSEVLLTQPIVLSEQANGSFATPGIQDFYLLLPTGFQFSGVEDEDLPVVQLNGADFVQSSLDIEFINNTIVHIQYQNSTITDLDNIIITDLKLIGAPGNSGDIKRFGGNAILPVLTNNKLASVTVLTNQPLKFTNSYSRDNDFSTFGFLPGPDLPPGEPAIIKAIPDNYIDPVLGGSIRLIPINPATNDYAPSEFLGNGVTNDVLNLGAVALDAAFDITINHVSVNGCIVESDEQYVVYDHVSPISLDLGITQADQHIGSKQSLVNPNFQTNLSLSPGYAPSPSLSTDQINSGDIAGYKLLDLYATIPTNLNNVGSQIINGADWEDQVELIPVVVNTIPDINSPTGFKKDYKWDYTNIINAVQDNPGITKDPYDNFRDTTLNNTIYWKGGSLGKIEFTGRYQSTADLTLTVPFRQQVELYVPPIPKIEVSGQPPMVQDTAIFCRNQSAITFNGWPDANAGLSTGYFELYDEATNTPIHTVASPNPGFTDNGNGVASLQPGILFNTYKTIRVEYTFSENNSPSKGTGYYYIKVTPNPIASFTATSVMMSAQPFDLGRPSATNAYCENNLIQFDNTSDANFPVPGYVANTKPKWNIGVSSAIEQTTPSATFTYTTHGRYIVTFSVQSQFGCPSQVASDSIYVGAIPVATFNLTGISTATPINVVDESSVADGPATNSSIASARWRYGSSTTFFSNATDTTYTIPGHYNITLLSTTQIIRTDQSTPPPVALPGCERTFTRPVIIVPALSADQVKGASIDQFESNDPLVQWQTASANSIPSSWQRGDAQETSSIELTGKVWATGLNSPYTLGEISYLYSPVYNLDSLKRPKVSFNHVSFMGTNDGVVLEFSTDNLNFTDPAKQWYRVGTNADGNNWYDRVGLASKPGTQKNILDGTISGDYGWSSRVDTVLHSQHTLSPDIPANLRTQVMFRFTLSSFDGSDEGFAFDDFRVGERTRVVLIENFTNAGNTNSIGGLNVEKRESDELKSAKFNGVGTDVIKMNYHVSFPNQDPFNNDFPADPSARALYYNISETPLARMDGGKSTDPQKKYFTEWGTGLYNLRTLKLAGADVEILDPDPSDNGGFMFYVRVTAATKALPIDTTILHIAFVEANPILPDFSLVKTGETNFEYVVKQMVPSALGTRFDDTLPAGESRTFGPFEWNPDLEKLYDNAGDLAIVAFLQNEKTKEVYQADILTALADPTLVTDVEDPDYAKKIHLFPNPANNEVNIQLPTVVNKSTPVEMFDTYGKSVYQSSFKAGEQMKTISTSELTGGVYFIQLITPDGNIARRKVMVIHR